MAAKSSFKPFVISFGKEDFLLDRDLYKARQWVGRRTILLDGEEINGEQLVSLCDGYSENPRTIIVDNAHKMKGDKPFRAYIESKQPEDSSVIIVGIVRSEKLPDVWSLAMAKGKGYERKAFKSWDNSALSTWIKLEVGNLKSSIDDETIKFLIQCVGTDLYRLSNEIKKLALYAGSLGKIQRDHIVLVTTTSPKADQFMLSEAVMAKDARRALNTFSNLYKMSGDDCLVLVVRALMRQVEKTALIRSLLDKGVSETDIAVLVGMKEWPFKNVAAPIARKHDLKSLLKHMGQLCKLDADVKGPARSKRTLVELTMLSIAQ